MKPGGCTYKGKFTLKVESITEKGSHVGASAVWADKYSKEEDPDPEYWAVQMLTKYFINLGQREGFATTGYKSCKMMMDGIEEQFRCASDYMGGEWYDFCLVNP